VTYRERNRVLALDRAAAHGPRQRSAYRVHPRDEHADHADGAGRDAEDREAVTFSGHRYVTGVPGRAHPAPSLRTCAAGQEEAVGPAAPPRAVCPAVLAGRACSRRTPGREVDRGTRGEGPACHARCGAAAADTVRRRAVKPAPSAYTFGLSAGPAPGSGAPLGDPPGTIATLPPRGNHAHGALLCVLECPVAHDRALSTSAHRRRHP
jgi:hypothetical protein